MTDGIDELRTESKRLVAEWIATYGDISEVEAAVKVGRRLATGVIFGGQYFVEGTMDTRFRPAMFDRLEGKVGSTQIVQDEWTRTCLVTLA